MPPYAAAAFFTVAIGFFADRTQQRGLCSIAVAPLGVIGFGLLLSDVRPGVKYFATFLAAMGIYSCIPNTIAWVAHKPRRGVQTGNDARYRYGMGKPAGRCGQQSLQRRRCAQIHSWACGCAGISWHCSLRRISDTLCSASTGKPP